MVCCGILLMQERAGQITLPPVSYVAHNPLASVRIVRRTADEPLFDGLMEEHHYLATSSRWVVQYSAVPR
jgi:hypothetical protein